MSRGIFATLAFSIAAGLVAAVFLADSEFLAIRVWASTSLICFTLLVVGGLLAAVAGEPQQMRPLWRRSPRTPEPRRADLLRFTDRQVSSALEQPRSFDIRLRPRIVHLVSQANLDPEAVGSAAWMIEGSGTSRAPLISELDEVLTALEKRP